MTDQAERFDRFAAGYARWWAPVLAPAVGTLVERIAQGGGPRPGARLLDVGTGTGQLAIATLERWPSTTVDGVDVSAGMMVAANAEADRRLAPGGSRPVPHDRRHRGPPAVRRRHLRPGAGLVRAPAGPEPASRPPRHPARPAPGRHVRLGHVARRPGRVRPGRGVRRCARGCRRGAPRMGRPLGRFREPRFGAPRAPPRRLLGRHDRAWRHRAPLRRRGLSRVHDRVRRGDARRRARRRRQADDSSPSCDDAWPSSHPTS